MSFDRVHDEKNGAMYGNLDYGYPEHRRAEVCYTVRYLMKHGHRRSKAIANAAFMFHVGKSSVYRWLQKEEV